MTRLSVPLCLSSVQEYPSLMEKTQPNTADSLTMPLGEVQHTPLDSKEETFVKSHILTSSTLCHVLIQRKQEAV